MSWNTGVSYGPTTPIDYSVFNGIGTDLRSWGGNVDAGGNTLSNLSALTGASGLLDISSTRLRLSNNDSHTGFATVATQEHLTLWNTNATSNNWIEMAFYSAAGTIAAGIGAQNVNPGSSYQALALFTRGTGGYLERMRITEEGLAGIGTGTPGGRLHVRHTTPNVIGTILEHTDGSTFSCGLLVENTAASGNVAAGILRVSSAQTLNSNQLMMVVSDAANTLFQIFGDGTVQIRNRVVLSNLPSSNPGAGTKQLWYDPADSNRVKFAA